MPDKNRPAPQNHPMAQPAPIKFAICNEIFQGWGIESALAFAAETGYDALEIAPFTLADSVLDISARRRREIRAAATKAGIAIAGIHWVLVKPEGLYITHPDAAIRRQTADYFCALVDFCADVGGTRIIVGSPKQRNLQPGVTWQQGWDCARETFAPAAQRAQERGVVLCLEPLSTEETNFITTARQAIEFIQTFANPNFQIILDVKAMCSEGRPLPEIIRESWPHFAHFHANDRNRKGPGFGEIDFKPIAHALKDVGYQGYVSVEVFRFEEGPESIARQSLANLRQAFYPGV
jgi:sugar phosphate isomerase/epimerase